ncbi:uncharacterized protein NDAI_0B01940 [Naumovozyma dairenensis CBS 421]|uniref:C2H2-type domain-containing protein n=1 Tax=Naumovozyma dairenensis (strain ATCC 10597 / BCRC 20456 / CBS 421 / NBRC 0211 / NRRL Y-12639) TaxID=1071378 RepID=G0W618_NAUDC|nr:hypothetical protein NDAI_0B01940 [Naumovozyma dairenensis CBS 421]CCD23229.1 hypothetical protein NDAI_0B01940 [Naumovozyma dairenensis CBS 421]
MSREPILPFTNYYQETKKLGSDRIVLPSIAALVSNIDSNVTKTEPLQQHYQHLRTPDRYQYHHKSAEAPKLPAPLAYTHNPTTTTVLTPQPQYIAVSRPPQLCSSAGMPYTFSMVQTPIVQVQAANKFYPQTIPVITQTPQTQWITANFYSTQNPPPPGTLVGPAPRLSALEPLPINVAPRRPFIVTVPYHPLCSNTPSSTSSLSSSSIMSSPTLPTNNYGVANFEENPNSIGCMYGDSSKLANIYRDPKIKNKKQCDICGKICSRPSTLKTHYLIHSGDTPFKCAWKGCTKAFNVKSNMLRHFKCHEKKARLSGGVSKVIDKNKHKQRGKRHVNK